VRYERKQGKIEKKTKGVVLGPEGNYKILQESTLSLWIHGNLYHLTCTAITLYTQSKKLLLTIRHCSFTQ